MVATVGSCSKSVMQRTKPPKLPMAPATPPGRGSVRKKLLVPPSPPFSLPPSDPQLTNAKGEKVVPGMIIYRQRGTLWFPGENAGIGRDHTIFALRTGYVRYYRDSGPKKRKSIGVALTPDQPLPRPPNAARTRRLGIEPVPLVEKEDVSVPQGTPLTQEDWAKVVPGSYIPRPDNWRIGKVMGPVVRKRSVFEGFERSAKRKEARLKKLALKGGKTKKAKAKAKARAKKARGG